LFVTAILGRRSLFNNVAFKLHQYRLWGSGSFTSFKHLLLFACSSKLRKRSLSGMPDPSSPDSLAKSNLTSADGHPVFTQAKADARNLTWQQIGVPSLGAMGSLIYTWINDYKLGHLDLRGGLRSLFFSLLIGIGLYIIVAFVRAPFIILARNHQRLLQLSSRLIAVEDRSANMLTSSTVMPPNKPEIECPACYIAEMGLTDRMCVEEGTGNQIALADFHMEPVEDSERWVEVRTNITFHDMGFETRLRVNDGVWLHSDKISLAFHRGETKTLVVALLSPKGILAYEHHLNEPGRNPKNTYLKPLIKPVNEERSFVEVRLIGEYLDQLRLDRTFWYEIFKSTKWEIRRVTEDELRS
jgi:hypothetical protein